jgi:hypothetical protein
VKRDHLDALFASLRETLALAAHRAALLPAGARTVQ